MIEKGKRKNSLPITGNLSDRGFKPTGVSDIALGLQRNFEQDTRDEVDLEEAERFLRAGGSINQLNRRQRDLIQSGKRSRGSIRN